MKTTIEIAKQLGLNPELAGHEYRAICPNHADENPSLYINPTNDSWYCFGCSRGGGPIQLHQFITGSSFNGATLAVLGEDGPGGFIKHKLRRTDAGPSDEGPFLLAALFRMWRGKDDAPMEMIVDALSKDDPVPGLLQACDALCCPQEAAGDDGLL